MLRLKKLFMYFKNIPFLLVKWKINENKRFATLALEIGMHKPANKTDVRLAILCS